MIASITTLFLAGASVFSIRGLGEDQSVFRSDFLGGLAKARIEFTLRPELALLNEGTSLRATFWTNPFAFSLKIPLADRCGFTLGNRSRFNQNIDIYGEFDALNVHLDGRGGIEEVYFSVNGRVPGLAEAYFCPAMLFGSAREIWEHAIGDYTIADTFTCNYRGTVFAAGLQVSIAALAFEGLSRIDIDRNDSTTAADLPERLSVGIFPRTEEYRFGIAFEHSFWPDSAPGVQSPNRLKLTVAGSNFEAAYIYNPWYLSGVNENGIAISTQVPVLKLGFFRLKLDACLRNRGRVREFKFVPEINLAIEEIFSRKQ